MGITMYLFFGIFILILFFFFCTGHCRRKKIMKKVCSMCPKEKYALLDELIHPFGYSYVPSQDIFSSRVNAWQRKFGYQALYDRAASYTNMVLNCLPVYFNYQGRTWLIEFWKGQYGIHAGCEIGVYYADRIVEENELKYTLFKCATDEDMLNLSFILIDNSTSIARLSAKHWWLTAFVPGRYCKPSDLSLRASVTLHSPEMAKAFAAGLQKAGYRSSEICSCRNTITFTFADSAQCGSRLHRLRIRIIQWCNRLGCRIYLSVTKPFSLSADRLLYLYYYLPFAFRRILRRKNNELLFETQ